MLSSLLPTPPIVLDIDQKVNTDIFVTIRYTHNSREAVNQMIEHKGKEFHTTKDLALSVIGGRWKIALVWALLQESPRRLNEFQKTFTDINQRMLIRQLRELEEDLIVHRTVYPVVPPKVEYTLTEIGLSLEPVVTAICDWGDSFHAVLTNDIPEKL